MDSFTLVVLLCIELSKVADDLVPLVNSASLLVALLTVFLVLVRGRS